MLSIHKLIVEEVLWPFARSVYGLNGPDGLDYSLGINNHFDGEIKRRDKTSPTSTFSLAR
ncbi:hypothetical protein MJ579_04765 [Klebsiella pneumoniae]|nr:hypothetical protein MJ579_04765 [Klebsiella pneumoniae]